MFLLMLIAQTDVLALLDGIRKVLPEVFAVLSVGLILCAVLAAEVYFLLEFVRYLARKWKQPDPNICAKCRSGVIDSLSPRSAAREQHGNIEAAKTA